MPDFDFRTEFAEKTVLELCIIAESDEYTQQARQTAKTLLVEQLGRAMPIHDVWAQELERLDNLSQKCHLCGNGEVNYTSPPFFFCKPKAKNLERLVGTALPTLAGVAGHLAAGAILRRAIYAKEEKVVKLTLNLCSECKKRRTKKRPFRKAEVSLSLEDYYSHPLYELYGPLGFTELTK